MKTSKSIIPKLVCGKPNEVFHEIDIIDHKRNDIYINYNGIKECIQDGIFFKSILDKSISIKDSKMIGDFIIIICDKRYHIININSPQYKSILRNTKNSNITTHEYGKKYCNTKDIGIYAGKIQDVDGNIKHLWWIGSDNKIDKDINGLINALNNNIDSNYINIYFSPHLLTDSETKQFIIPTTKTKTFNIIQQLNKKVIIKQLLADIEGKIAGKYFWSDIVDVNSYMNTVTAEDYSYRNAKHIKNMIQYLMSNNIGEENEYRDLSILQRFKKLTDYLNKIYTLQTKV